MNTVPRNADETSLVRSITTQASRDDLPWRDNAYLAFWSADNAVRGVVHVSTSPNWAGRRARVSISVNNVAVEFAEELDPGTFTSASVEYDQSGHRIEVRHDEVTLELRMTPSLSIADYSTTDVIPALVPDHPLQHLQQRATVVGSVVLHGEGGPSEVKAFSGAGLRDRTWGYRDEGAAFSEYVAVMVDFGESFVTAMKFKGVDGSIRMNGFELFADRAEPIDALSIRRDSAGLFSGARINSGSDEREIERTRFVGGFWVPMGTERTGPTFSAYDEFVTVKSGGAGVIEQGILRTLF